MLVICRLCECEYNTQVYDVCPDCGNHTTTDYLDPLIDMDDAIIEEQEPSIDEKLEDGFGETD